MRKKLFAIVMSLTMMLTFMPAMAFAEPGNVTDIKYQLSDEREVLTLYDYQVEEGYYPHQGDQLIVVTSDGEIAYTYDEEDEVFKSEDGDTISRGDVIFGNVSRASDNDPYSIDVEYKACSTQIRVDVLEVPVASISFTAKEPKVVYDYECEQTEDGYICEPALDEGDSVTITYKDDTSATYILKYEDEGPIWVNKNDQDDTISMEVFNIIPASVPVDAADGASFEFDIEYLNVKTKSTVTFKKSPYTDFSFTQSGKYLYVLEECDLAYNETNDEYVLDDANYAEYLGSEGDVLSFTLSDNSTVKFEYGYRWNGFYAADDSGNKLSPERMPEREILFKDNQLRWKKDSNGYYINDTAKLTYMGTVSDKTVKTYVGNMVWFEPEGGDGRANFTVPLGMSVNDLTNTDATVIPIISKSGYTFCGWYEKDPNTGELKADPFDFDTMIEEETFLFAKWEEASDDSLDTAKASAKAELDSYKNASDYRAVQQTELANAIAAGKAAIDAAEDTDGVDAALAEAKASIDKIKTDAQLTAEEAQKAAMEEQERQGTRDKAIPKVKINKPKAGKKAVTVKWKKLSKKQLKKSKVTGYEIWVCPNKAFGPNDTVIKTAGKKKASLKVKGLNKGTYYVKVRAIRYDNNIKIVGKWSTVRKVRIRK